MMMLQVQHFLRELEKLGFAEASPAQLNALAVPGSTSLTAIAPAIGRRLEEMPEGARVEVLAEIPHADDRQSWRSSADVDITWLERDGAAGNGSDLLEQALRALSTPAGDTFYWIATESHRARNMRLWLSQERGVCQRTG